MIEVEIYYAAHGRQGARWRVVQVFAESAITPGHRVTLRQNYTERGAAERYAVRVRAVGFECA